jgi:hypothetical protein
LKLFKILYQDGTAERWNAARLVDCTYAAHGDAHSGSFLGKAAGVDRIRLATGALEPIGGD